MIKRMMGNLPIKEMLKFLVGGGTAVLVDAIVYAVLKSYIDISIAKAISYITGAIVGFIINKIWTFESKQFKWSEVAKYILLYAFSACANTLVNKVVLMIIPSVIFAFLCATGTSTIINYIGQKFVVFRKDKS